MTSHSFHIGRWKVTYRATSTGRAAEVRDRLDKMIPTELAHACAERLTRGIAAADSSVWLIRHLSLGLTLAAEPARAAISAQQWGEHLAAKVQTAIHRGEEDDSVIHFPSRAAYIAQFIHDLAAGRATGKWYYEEFESLLPLSTSRAICEALSREPELTGSILLGLIEIRGLRDALLAMTETDCRAAFEAWRRSLASPGGADDDRWAGRLLEVWNETPLRDAAGHAFRDGLWWAALAISRHGVLEGDKSMLDTIGRLLDLRSLLSALDLGSRELVIEHLADGDLESALAAARRQGLYDAAETLAFFQGAMGGDAEWARNAQGVLLGESEYVRKSAPKIFPHGPAIPSAYAGIFRLGPSFVASGVEYALAPLDPESAAAFRHLVAVKCMGRANAILAFSDPAMRLFSRFQGASLVGFPALPETPDSAAADESYFSCAGALDGVSRDFDVAGTRWAQIVLRHFARRLLGFESATPPHLYRNFLRGDGFVRDTGEAIVVELTSPPLAVVLSIAGILEESYVLPWIEKREVCVLRLPE